MITSVTGRESLRIMSSSSLGQIAFNNGAIRHFSSSRSTRRDGSNCYLTPEVYIRASVIIWAGLQMSTQLGLKYFHFMILDTRDPDVY